MKYDSNANNFTCTCEYTQFSGFICRHIFRAAMQLNLNELPTSLFYERWRKNPSEEKLANNYNSFYSCTVTNLQKQALTSNNNSDHQYMLTRLLQKV